MSKQISIFKNKTKKFEALFSDGHLTVIVWTGEKYRLEGKSLMFQTLDELSEYYKGTIKSIREIK